MFTCVASLYNMCCLLYVDSCGVLSVVRCLWCVVVCCLVGCLVLLFVVRSLLNCVCCLLCADCCVALIH